MNSIEGAMTDETICGDLNGPLSYWGPIASSSDERVGGFAGATGSKVTAGAFLSHSEHMALLHFRSRVEHSRDGFDGFEEISNLTLAAARPAIRVA